jgi:hypothetical protein
LRGGKRKEIKKEGRKMFRKYMAITLDIIYRLQFFQDDASEPAQFPSSGIMLFHDQSF